jgi:hypothetical protein
VKRNPSKCVFLKTVKSALLNEIGNWLYEWLACYSIPHPPSPLPFPPPSLGASSWYVSPLVTVYYYMRLRLMGAPGITHEPCSYPAVLSSS